jgi:hypothetical protein
MNQIPYNETIVVLEDIDAMSSITHSRKLLYKEEEKEEKEKEKEEETEKKKERDKEKEKETELTLSGLLNHIDGLHNNHGMIMIMTTNFPERLDEALIRDGRVDEKIFFDYIDHDTLYLMFKNFYGTNFNKTMSDIKKVKVENNIAPCKVENFLKKYYDNCDKALSELILFSENPTVFTNFEKF